MEPRVLYRCFYIAPFLIKLCRIQIAYSQIVSSVQISAVNFQKAYSLIYQQEAYIPTGIEHHNKCVRGRDPRVVDSVQLRVRVLHGVNFFRSILDFEIYCDITLHVMNSNILWHPMFVCLLICVHALYTFTILLHTLEDTR